MEEPVEPTDRNNEGISHNNSRMQSHRTPQKRSLSNYVESIREGLRKIGGCQDVEDNDIMRPIKNSTNTRYDEALKLSREKSQKYHKTKNRGNKRKCGDQESGFEAFLDTVPKLDSFSRTIDWVHHSDLQSGSRVSLSALPMRGTILPTRYTSVHYPNCNDDSFITSISSYESIRGTHGRNTPPVMDPKTPHLDHLFQQLQQKQEREARKQMIASGEQHLLSFNLLDVYSHQVAGMPLGTTPEIIPFMATQIPYSHKQIQNSELYTIKSKKIPQPLELFNYCCQWLHCSRQFKSAVELFSHVDQFHVQAYSMVTLFGNRADNRKCRIACKWANCTKVYSARYKLLLHVHNEHCKELPHHTITRVSVSLIIMPFITKILLNHNMMMHTEVLFMLTHRLYVLSISSFICYISMLNSKTSNFPQLPAGSKRTMECSHNYYTKTVSPLIVY